MNLRTMSSPNRSPGRLDRNADLVVIHYTAGGALMPTCRWLCLPAAQASAHFVVGRSLVEGVMQLVDLEDAAWHAWPSSWKGREGCNGFSVGIEICNRGWFDKIDSNGRPYRSEGNRRVYAPEGVEPVEIGGKYWEPYTAYQYPDLPPFSVPRSMLVPGGFEGFV